MKVFNLCVLFALLGCTSFPKRKLASLPAKGPNHDCNIIDGGKVECWGKSKFGAIGNGTDDGHTVVPVLVKTDLSQTPLTGVRALLVGKHHNCVRTKEKYVYCWGKGDRGQLGHSGTTSRSIAGPVVTNAGRTRLHGVISIWTWKKYTCALTESNERYCWGDGVLVATPID